MNRESFIFNIRAWIIAFLRLPWYYRATLLFCLMLSFAMPCSALLFNSNVQASSGVHIVRQGENLSTIARFYDVSLGDLIDSNRIANPDIIRVGQQLAVPGLVAAKQYDTPADLTQLPGQNGYFTISRGDTLTKIAILHGVTAADLMRLNGLKNRNDFEVSQQLRVTARVASQKIDSNLQFKRKLADYMHLVQSGETLEKIANAYKLPAQELLVMNGLPLSGFIWEGQALRIRKPAKPSNRVVGLAEAPVHGHRSIEIDISEQTLTAWQGGVAVLRTKVSTGTSATPTVIGNFRVGHKLSSQRMTGPGYDLPGVPWVMYFYSAYAIHGAYWHNNFGTPMSHGCVNMRPHEAKFLYEWAPQGTEVNVHY